jgi:Aspartate racemase
MDANDLSGMANYFAQGIDKLGRAGADFGIISANTPHIVFDEVAPKVTDSTDQHCRGDRALRPKRKTETARLIRDALHDAGNFLSESLRARRIELACAGLHDQDYIHDKYMNELVPENFWQTPASAC